MSDGMLATPANMRKLARLATPNARLMAYSPRTYEQYSATAGDYFMMRDDEVLTDANGDPMVLAYTYEAIVIVEDPS